MTNDKRRQRWEQLTHLLDRIDRRGLRDLEVEEVKNLSPVWGAWLRTVVRAHLGEEDAAAKSLEEALTSGIISPLTGAHAYAMASVPVARRDAAKGRRFRDRAIELLPSAV